MFIKFTNCLLCKYNVNIILRCGVFLVVCDNVVGVVVGLAVVVALVVCLVVEGDRVCPPLVVVLLVVESTDKITQR